MFPEGLLLHSPGHALRASSAASSGSWHFLFPLPLLPPLLLPLAAPPVSGAAVQSQPAPSSIALEEPPGMPSVTVRETSIPGAATGVSEGTAAADAPAWLGLSEVDGGVIISPAFSRLERPSLHSRPSQEARLVAGRRCRAASASLSRLSPGNCGMGPPEGPADELAEDPALGHGSSTSTGLANGASTFMAQLDERPQRLACMERNIHCVSQCHDGTSGLPSGWADSVSTLIQEPPSWLMLGYAS